MLRSDRAIDIVLTIAVVVDTVLVIRTLLDPTWWPTWLHERNQLDPAERALLYRCMGHWAAFAVFQIAGLVKWRAWSGWLLIVAGIRFSDVFTDWSYLAATSELTTATGWLGLASAGFVNWAMALFLVWSWRTRNAGQS